MDDNVTRLQYQGKEILLIATAHVSQQSIELVKRVIEEEKPDSICIELDEKRFQTMQNPKAWESTDIIQVIKSKQVGFLLANLALGSYQKRIAKKLDAQVGGEMLEGIRSAEETGATLVLADRSLQITFLRIWRSLGLWEKAKLVFGLVFSFDEDQDISDEALQDLLKQDILEAAMSEVRQKFPTIGQILIHERDQHLAAKIRESPGTKVVAILGGAHVPGITEEIYKDQDLEALNYVPPKGAFSKLAGWVIPAIIIGLIVYSFIISTQTGMKQLISWMVWNGGLAAIFTVAALGHPLSILTALAAAPFTSLNPFLACGWFAGLVEASIRKPTVEDVQNVQTDIFSLKGFFKNRFLKILLVVIMANIGSSIGTFAAGFDIIKNLM